MATGSVSVLGELLVRSGLVEEKQVKEAFEVSKKEGKRLGSVLVKMGFVKEDALATFFSKQYKIPLIDMSQYQIDTELVKKIPFERAKRNILIPITMEGDALRIAIADPTNNPAIEDIKFITRMKVAVHVATESAIMKAIEAYYPKTEQLKAAATATPAKSTEKTSLDMSEIDKIIKKTTSNVAVVEQKEEKISLADAGAAPIIQLVNAILMNAINDRASDIHIEPREKEIHVRYRIDGVLKQAFPPFPEHIKNPLVSRIKIMSRLDISERRIPQDGRIKIKFGENSEIDFRVSTLPLQFGEKVVMRILDKSNLNLDLSILGFDETQLNDFVEAIEKPYGMVLVTGPTGSGKTTTLYSGLSHLNKPGVNIMTAEDPVEYNLAGINQVQVKPEVGLTFAAALRSFLRQDPDIILVGEIRDQETAEIGVKAALTGHLVLSTLHTNDAPATITRLLNIGIEPFLVSSSVILVIAQRLARRICKDCEKIEQKVSEQVLLKAGVAPEEIAGFKCYVGKGCDSCNNTGYKGRLAMHEVMPMRADLKEVILNGGTAESIKREAVRLGMRTLRQSGLYRVKQGMTTIDEVFRSTFGD
ncbi:type IV-A pilus assembly ATPase PilB [Candidatus Magnetobacterium casense]|uniref:Type IV-A pilus assembly ATPase PilB n=1 Tax=Candidatus Magnetobacterium casense TaxID=1455061 RepID=A0ABS6RX19_9BACT|nr:type IV-A pilus assembly ATPase PilB [Candidatus Magnetobacterium casensis]MBV6341166.1 type IV-A pilus assembly ATPase PilB [Candidatus Magnetobacterium casensis]